MTQQPEADPTPHELVRIAAEAASAKLGRDVIALDVGDVMGITDAFVLVTGANNRQVATIVDEVQRRLREDAGLRPRSVEGLDDRSWVLLDYGALVVHVFRAETREFYGLERLWSDAARIHWQDAATSPNTVATTHRGTPGGGDGT